MMQALYNKPRGSSYLKQGIIMLYLPLNSKLWVILVKERTVGETRPTCYTFNEKEVDLLLYIYTVSQALYGHNGNLSTSLVNKRNQFSEYFGDFSSHLLWNG